MNTTDPLGPARPRRPVPLHIGVGLMVLSLLAGGAFSLLGLTSALDHSDEDGAFLFTISLVIVAVDLVLAILVWFGKLWARTVLTILVVGNVLLGIFTGQGLTGILGVAAVAVMYFPSSTDWLREQRDG